MKDDMASPVSRLRALPRPRPATAIALLALLMAMGGTSIAGSVINGNDLKNGSVTRPKIGSNAIDSTRLAGNAVTAGKIAKAAVSSSKLAKGAVNAAALASGSVTSKALGAGAVTASNLAPAAVSWKSLGAQVVAAAPVVLPVGTTQVIPATAAASLPGRDRRDLGWRVDQRHDERLRDPVGPGGSTGSRADGLGGDRWHRGHAARHDDGLRDLHRGRFVTSEAA